MELYTQTKRLANELWAESAETPWPWQTTGLSVPGSKVPHLSVADELFIAAVVNTPRPLRPWGAITQLSGMFQVSRPTIYALGRRAAEGLKRSVGGRPAKEQPPAAADEKHLSSNTLVVTPNRRSLSCWRLTSRTRCSATALYAPLPGAGACGRL